MKCLVCGREADGDCVVVMAVLALAVVAMVAVIVWTWL